VTAFRPNSFGLGEALVGLAVGFVLGTVFVSIFGALSHHPNHPSGFGSDVASLVGLWIGLVGSAIAAAVRNDRAARALTPGKQGTARTGIFELLRRDYGLTIRPWPDIPLGIAVVWLLELPLAPFVPHLFTRLSQPAVSLTGNGKGAGLVVLGVLVCLGSPVVEELYFRGVLLRSIAGRLGGLGPALGPVASVVLVGAVFGLVHFEPLQLLALAGFGMVLCVLAWRTGRLGPGIIAHLAFNTAAFVTVANSH
jgi:hypothetical protein